jgi:NitT/TauT family transport system permease protein
MKYRYIVYVVSILFFFISWQFMDTSFILSKPTDVLLFLQSFLVSELFWSNFIKTLGRVITSCFLALGIGIFLAATVRTKHSYIYELFYPVQFMSAAVLTLISILLFGLSPYIPIFVVTVSIIPNIYVACEIGIRHLRKDLNEIGTLYSINKFKTFWHITLPQIAPYITNGLIRAHAVAWKVVVTTELFVVAEGLGFLLNQYFKLMQFEKMFGLSLIIILSAMLLDLVLRTIKNRLTRETI